MKVGIPRALLYYYYMAFWEPFFKNIGIEVVTSPETNKEIIDQGVKASVPEICVPMKIFIGHTVYLLNKEVDYIFVPRMVSIREGEVFCPKFMGLPDMIEHGVAGTEGKVLSCHINSKSDDISNYKNYLSIGEKLGISAKEIKRACKEAKIVWNKYREYNMMGYTSKEALSIVMNGKAPKMNESNKGNRVKIGLLGYVYNIYDDFVSMDVVSKLRELDVDFETFDMMNQEELMKNIDDMDKVLFWTFSNKLLGAGYKMFRNSEVDGVIHITAFGCGPDSFLGTLFEIESDSTGIPFMTIRIDEHTGENHLQTRIEAFIDMLKRKKATQL